MPQWSVSMSVGYHGWYANKARTHQSIHLLYTPPGGLAAQRRGQGQINERRRTRTELPTPSSLSRSPAEGRELAYWPSAVPTLAPE
ncbi:hypothetical protein BaRGS_00013445 [Batillaria attramentaria]|uniref:Uncharacterized protein n=1 Tax=Batillaria attramentaria TaxID=370345 RepID=A0ABD0L715_9CAEN